MGRLDVGLYGLDYAKSGLRWMLSVPYYFLFLAVYSFYLFICFFFTISLFKLWTMLYGIFPQFFCLFCRVKILKGGYLFWKKHGVLLSTFQRIIKNGFNGSKCIFQHAQTCLHLFFVDTYEGRTWSCKIWKCKRL